MWIIKTDQYAWNPTKNKNYHGKQPDDGCLRYFHYYPKRESTVIITELNLHA